MSLSQVHCESCRFWVQEGDRDDGQCKFNPPTVAVFVSPVSGVQYEQLPVWTNLTDWCGRGEVR